jgi:two-component system chemotaxis response regulator CheB
MTFRVLIVDDSSFFRNRLSDIISADPNLEVVGTAADGEQAIKATLQLKPDIITMDIEMPNMDGITAVRTIMDKRPTAILMLATTSAAGAKTTLEALEAGAVDYMPKRFEDIARNQQLAHQKLCQRLYQLALNFKNMQPTHSLLQAKIIASRQSLPPHPIKLIAIGTSTGGPIALQKILSQLPANFPHPLLLIQHMPAAFTHSFAERLNTQCAITVKQAIDGEKILAGVAYLAPGGQQMLLKGSQDQPYLQIQNSDTEQTYHPCIDLTLESISTVCPAETLAIILTGMGADGRHGCEILKQLQATVWSQDEQSSTIYGMPMAIAKASLADKVLSLADIGQQLSEIKA